MGNAYQALGPLPATKPDIFLVIASLAGGGAERVCSRLANYWAERNHSVWLVVLQAEGAFLQQIDSRVHLISLRRARARHGVWRLARVLAQAPRVPVLIFGFELGVIGGWLKLAWACENPIIYREGNNPWFQVSRRRRWLYGALIGWVDGCIAQGGYVRSQLRRLGVAGQPIEVIANPLPRSAPVQDGDRQPTPVFMAAGRLVPEKGFQRLLDGFSALESTYPNRRLIIAGAGPESCRLHEYAGRLALGQRVEFCGFIEQLQPLYQGADLFVLPSRHEGQPNVLLEALLAGCRVLAAGGEPVRDLLTEIGLPECWISSERFVEHFVQRVPLVLALPAERWRAARLRLQEMTDLAIVAQRYWAFCQALAEARRERVTA